MQVISFVTQKGGSGKSTTAASVAIAAFQAGRKVFMLEMDKQGTLSEWYESRKAEDGPDFEKLATKDLLTALETLKTSGYDLVVIDTPGVDSPDNNTIMRASDLCLIPARPTAADLRGCAPTVQALIRLNKPFSFILTQCPPRSPRVEEARAGLAALGIIAEPPIVSRADHQDALAAGQGVTEFNPEGAAAQEIKQLLNWIENKLAPKVKRNVKVA